MRPLIFTISIFLCTISNSQIRLPKLISDNMVLQRDETIKLWGWASINEKIELQFNQKQYQTTTSKEGKWEISLPAQKAGGPFDMVFTASNTITVKNILFGDIWICTGQSNMVLPMERVKELYVEDIEAANYPQIRNLFIPTKTNLGERLDDLPNGSAWKIANPTDVLTFGAVSYFFARNLYDKYKVPIGIINSSVGGTPIEAWTSEAGFKPFPEMVSTIQKNKDTAYVNSKNRAAVNSQRPAPKIMDKGLTEPVLWYDTAYIPKGWRNINIPGFWEDQGLKELNGVVWYRKEIDVPASMVGMSAKIFMGRIVDADFMYVNGKQIGNITYQYPPRRYEVPAGLLKVGKNVLVIRVINTLGKGGFVPDKPYYLLANGQKMDLKGTWQYKVGEVFVPQLPTPQGINAQNQPTALYNAMIAPLTNYTSKGFVWYQGETNAGQPNEYDKLLKTLINDWRSQWQVPNAPFLFVQLANFMDYTYLPTESNWATLRNGQRKALAMPNTAMVVTTDCGEWNDIHPLNKKEVGIRLSLAAQKLAYNENVEYSGPLFENAKIEDDKIIITFKHTGSGLVSNDGELLRYFAIAGADKKFVWANATIEGNTVIVWSNDIKQPKYVRYNWADNPDGNLYNKEGLPASVFETE